MMLSLLLLLSVVVVVVEDDGYVDDSPITNLARNVRQSSSLSDRMTSSSSSSDFALNTVASMCDLYKLLLDVMVTDDGANENAHDVQ